MFRHQGQTRGFWRGSPEFWLVRHAPRYMRLEDHLAVIELVTGTHALESMQHPTRVSVLTENSKVLLARSDGREFCVVGDRLSYHTTARDVWPEARPVSVPLAVHGEREQEYLDSGWSGDRRPIGQVEHLADILGATLNWCLYIVSHGTLLLMANGLPGEPFLLHWARTWYVDCPATIHRVRLRMVTAEERKALRPRVSSRLADQLDRDNGSNVAFGAKDGLLIIECEEGEFPIWAGGLLLSWKDKGDWKRWGFV